MTMSGAADEPAEVLLQDLPVKETLATTSNGDDVPSDR